VAVVHDSVEAALEALLHEPAAAVTPQPPPAVPIAPLPSKELPQRPQTSSGSRPTPVPVPPTVQASVPPPREAFADPSDAKKPAVVGGAGFWDRLNASKAVKTAKPVETASPPVVVSALPTPALDVLVAPASEDTGKSAPKVGGSGFWERLNASKAAESAKPAPEIPPPAAVSPAEADRKDKPAATVGGSGFWERLNAAKAGAAPAPAPAPAPAGCVGGGGFWERLNASKAAGGNAVSAPERPATAPTFQFRAPDGTGFNDRAAYRRYMFETYYCFRNKSGEKLLKLPGQVDGYARL
jgi:hypothetical protein